MAESVGSEESGTKYEAPRAVRLSDAATGAAYGPDCKSGSGPGHDCLSGSSVAYYYACRDGSGHTTCSQGDYN
jgi:hypothetical protein